MSQHPEIIAAPFTVWLAPVGTAFPTVDEEPAAPWRMLGTNGVRNYAAGGVTVSHQRTIVQPPPPAGETVATVAMAEVDRLRVTLQMLDITLEEYATVLGGNAVSTTAAGPGTAGYKVLGLALPTGALPPFAALVRGPSPYAESMVAQYEIPSCYEGGNPTLTFSKGEVAALNVELVALPDPAATSEGMRFGRLVAQNEEPLPPPLPSFTEAPSITGTPAVGETLTLDRGTVVDGTLTGAELRRDGLVIDADPGATYSPVFADIGTLLTLRSTASGPGGDAEATSAAFGPIGAGAERLAATHTRHHATRNTTNKQVLSRSVHTTTAAMSEVRIAVAGYTLAQNVAGETALGGAQTVWAHLEYPVGTKILDLTWDGGASGVVPDGGLKFSDWNAIGTTIPEGAEIAFVMLRESTTGILYNTFHNFARGDRCQVAVSGLTPASMTGTITQSSTFGACPQLILTRGVSAPSICIIGDSVPAGFGDTAESTTAAGPGLRGSIAKSLDGLAFHNIATGGLQATTWPSLSTGRANLLPYFTHYVIDIGKNDCYVAIRSTAQIVADVEAIYAQILAANPAAKIIGCTQMHKSTSSDSWATSGGQTVLSRTATMNGFNDIMRTSGLTGMNEGYFEIADQVATARNSGIWKNDGSTAFLWTLDGVHPGPFGYTGIESSGVVDIDAPSTPSGGTPPPEPPAGPEAELVALLAAAGGQSSYHDFAQATNTGTWTSLDFTGLNNTMTQGTVSAQPAIGATGATFDGGDCVNQTITGGTFTVLMQFTKADASTDGFMLSDQGNTGQVRYTSGGAGAVTGTSVNGVAATSTGALYTALHATGVRIVKIESANFTGDTQLRIARAGTGAVGLIRRVAVLDHTALGAGLAAAVAKAEEVMALA